MYSAGVGLCQGCPLSSVVIVIFKDRSQGTAGGRSVSSSEPEGLRLCFLQILWFYRLHPPVIWNLRQWFFWKGVNCSCWERRGSYRHKPKSLSVLDRVLLTSEGKMKLDMDRQLRGAFFCIAGIVPAYYGKTSRKPNAKRSMCPCNCVPAVTDGYQLWEMSDRKGLMIQVTEMRSLRMVAGFSLQQKTRSSE